MRVRMVLGVWGVVLVLGLLSTGCPLRKSGSGDGAEGGVAASASAVLPANVPATSASGAAAHSPSASPSASAAPNVDAKGHPCKQWEAVVEGRCEQLCYSDNQCKGGMVCNGEIPGRTDKGKYCGQRVCKGAEKHLRENHYTVHCMIPCKTDANCKGGKKCGDTEYYNEDANGEVTHGCE